MGTIVKFKKNALAPLLETFFQENPSASATALAKRVGTTKQNIHHQETLDKYPRVDTWRPLRLAIGMNRVPFWEYMRDFYDPEDGAEGKLRIRVPGEKNPEVALRDLVNNIATMQMGLQSEARYSRGVLIGIMLAGRAIGVELEDEVKPHLHKLPTSE